MEKEKKYKTFRSLIIHGTIGMGMEMGKGQKTHIQHIIKQIAQYTIINSSAHVYQLQLRRIHISPSLKLKPLTHEFPEFLSL